jgi:hypothetical protein
MKRTTKTKQDYHKLFEKEEPINQKLTQRSNEKRFERKNKREKKQTYVAEIKHNQFFLSKKVNLLLKRCFIHNNNKI